MSAVLTLDTAEGVRQLEERFGDRVHAEPDGAGGAYVTVADIELGDRWNVPVASLSFHLPYNYPAAALYPFYLPGGTEPIDSWPSALQLVQWRGIPVIQVSLRHTNWHPAHDSAVGSVLQVQSWLRSL